MLSGCVYLRKLNLQRRNEVNAKAVCGKAKADELNLILLYLNWDFGGSIFLGQFFFQSQHCSWFQCVVCVEC